MANFTTGIDDIFGSLGKYPAVEGPDDPKPNNKASSEIWKVAYSAKSKFEEKLETEKHQLFGVMMGQMCDSSKDLIRETDIGRKAFSEKCSLQLLKGALQTHMPIATIERSITDTYV